MPGGPGPRQNPVVGPDWWANLLEMARRALGPTTPEANYERARGITQYAGASLLNHMLRTAEHTLNRSVFPTEATGSSVTMQRALDETAPTYPQAVREAIERWWMNAQRNVTPRTSMLDPFLWIATPSLMRMFREGQNPPRT